VAPESTTVAETGSIQPLVANPQVRFAVFKKYIL
jgi:hypothetical protein